MVSTVVRLSVMEGTNDLRATQGVLVTSSHQRKTSRRLNSQGPPPAMPIFPLSHSCWTRRLKSIMRERI
eukprot:972649-Amorphochlora_amoeboformis.AAC.1